MKANKYEAVLNEHQEKAREREGKRGGVGILKTG